MSNKPVDSMRDYPVEIAIFERQNDTDTWFTADVAKTYKDGEEYKKTRNFNRNDLLRLNALLPQAITRMQELAQHQSQAPAPAQNGHDMQAIKESAQNHIEKGNPEQEQGLGQ